MVNSINHRQFTLVLLLFCLLFGTMAQAEIVDFIYEDSIIGPGTMTKDIDGDGNDDFVFEITEKAQVFIRLE